MRVAAKTAYTSLRILLVYECNANVVYFDGVQLFNTYDPWGEACGMSGTPASTLGAMNPLRYRGYVYDTETGLHYLNSQYYNPVWGRFINTDLPTLTLYIRCLQGAEKHLAASLLPPFLLIFGYFLHRPAGRSYSAG